MYFLLVSKAVRAFQQYFPPAELLYIVAFLFVGIGVAAMVLHNLIRVAPFHPKLWALAVVVPTLVVIIVQFAFASIVSTLLFAISSGTTVVVGGWIAAKYSEEPI